MSTTGARVQFQTQSLSDLAEQIRIAIDRAGPATEKVLAVTADRIKDRAKKNAEFSEKTESTIKVVPGPKQNGMRTFRVESGGGDSPLPFLFEFGDPNKGGRVWRHPTFGHDPWVDQDAHPYMRPALEDTLSEINQIANDAVQIWLDRQFADGGEETE